MLNNIAWKILLLTAVAYMLKIGKNVFMHVTAVLKSGKNNIARSSSSNIPYHKCYSYANGFQRYSENQNA